MKRRTVLQGFGLAALLCRDLRFCCWMSYESTWFPRQ